MGSAERRTYHVQVINLKVPTQVIVGRTTFAPGDELRAMAERSRDDSTGPWRNLVERALGSTSFEWAAATVEAEDEPMAREAIRESVALLRLFQRERYKYISLEHQTFGLIGEVGSVPEIFWVSEGGRLRSWTGVHRGIIGTWTFTDAELAAFHDDPAFVSLHGALRLSPSERSDVGRRSLSALGIVNLATLMLPDEIRIALIAVALESLLGDDPPRARAHRACTRYAYMTCDTVGDGSGLHSAGRPACVYLETLGRDQGTLLKAIKEKFPSGGGLCSAYAHADAIFAARNALLHEGLRSETLPRAEELERRVDNAILALVRWSLRSGADTITRLDEEIDGLVREATGAKTSGLAARATKRNDQSIL